MQLHFAPLQGYADHIYRRHQRAIYGDAIDWYYTPFIRMEKGVPRRQDMTRLESAWSDGTPLIPQIIFNTPDEFVTLAQGVKALGCDRARSSHHTPPHRQSHPQSHHHPQIPHRPRTPPLTPGKGYEHV